MTKLYNANDGLTGRTGGPYLDIEQAKQAEISRAVAEDREPNFETMASGPSIQLVTAEQLITQAGHNRPSDFDPKTTSQSAVDGIVANSDNNLTVFVDTKDDEADEPVNSEPEFDAEGNPVNPDGGTPETTPVVTE